MNLRSFLFLQSSSTRINTLVMSHIKGKAKKENQSTQTYGPSTEPVNAVLASILQGCFHKSKRIQFDRLDFIELSYFKRWVIMKRILTRKFINIMRIEKLLIL